MKDQIVIHWFRQDLRISDNPALSAAAQQGRVLPIYILDDESAQEYSIGAASRWWLYHSLKKLNVNLQGKLRFFRGNAEQVLTKLAIDFQVCNVYWNRCYEPWRVVRDQRIEERLADRGIRIETHNGSLLWEPWQVLKSDQTPYKVFTPFYRKGCLSAEAPRTPLPEPEKLQLAQGNFSDIPLQELGLLPTTGWDKSLQPHWQIGETAAYDRLLTFLQTGLEDYKEGRNFPAKANVSRMSPHLHFGELSPNQAWHAIKRAGDDSTIEHFLSELGWREFSYSLLYHNPELPKINLQAKFDRFPWRSDPDALARWQQGQTGCPIVDAGMRELWQTGYIHNRVRMIVGSFLVKNLLLDWREGLAWFWDCLVDADLANNSASWQWIAGCGADAAPFFRIFNPVTQGQKFDSQGEYTRQYVPELTKLPDKYLFCPWTAPKSVLQESGVILGESYPELMVDLKLSRERALEAFKALKKAPG